MSFVLNNVVEVATNNIIEVVTNNVIKIVIVSDPLGSVAILNIKRGVRIR